MAVKVKKHLGNLVAQRIGINFQRYYVMKSGRPMTKEKELVHHNTRQQSKNALSIGRKIKTAMTNTVNNNILLMCARCNKPVDKLENDRDTFSCSSILTVFCHGEVGAFRIYDTDITGVDKMTVAESFQCVSIKRGESVRISKLIMPGTPLKETPR